jgi:sugar-specific transcriptional regulator TrmB
MNFSEAEIEKLKDSLMQFGFSEKEAEVYVSLLQSGETAVYALAKRSGVKPSTVYFTLDNLIEKGAVLRVPNGKKEKFTAKPLEQLLYLLKLKVSRLEVIAENFKQDTEKTEVLFFNGFSSLRRLLLENGSLQENNEILGFYGTAENIDKEIEEIFKQQNKIRNSLGVKVRAIAPESDSLAEWRSTDMLYNRNVKVVPKAIYNSNLSIDIENRKVTIIDYKNKKGILVKDKDFANTFKQIFEMVWQSQK